MKWTPRKAWARLRRARDTGRLLDESTLHLTPGTVQDLITNGTLGVSDDPPTIRLHDAKSQVFQNVVDEMAEFANGMLPISFDPRIEQVVDWRERTFVELEEMARRESERDEMYALDSVCEMCGRSRTSASTWLDVCPSCQEQMYAD